MILDKMAELSDGQAVTSTGDTASTNIYDTGAAQDLGVGEVPYINVIVDTTATSGGSATVQAVLQTSTDNSTWTDALIGKSFAVAAVTAGTKMLQAPFPVGLNRYLRVAYRVGTATLTAGKFDAFVTLGVQANTTYANGFTVA